MFVTSVTAHARIQINTSQLNTLAENNVKMLN